MSFRRALPFALLAAAACAGGSNEAQSQDDASAPDTSIDATGQDDADAGAGDAATSEIGEAGDGGDGGDDVSLFPTDDGGLRDFPLPDIPSSCTAARIFMYAPNGYATLLDALEADKTACADYYVHVAADPTDKTKPRGGGVPNAIRARQGRFHATAEFNWSAWAASSTLTWLEKGAEFRARMDAAGYNVARGDTWAIVELPASVRTDPTMRGNVRDLLHGLQAPSATAVSRQGFVLIPSQPQSTTALALLTYRSQTETFLGDAAFWTQVGAATIGFGEEAWVEPSKTCVSGASISTMSDNVNAFAEHPAILAAAGPASAANARTAFGSVYFPVLDAALGSTTYFTSALSIAQMQAYVSLQVYANRAYADGHATPGRRIGFLWDDAPKTVGSPTDLKTLAGRLAAAIRGAYDPSGTPSSACAGGATTSCQCVLAGAAFNTGWSTFTTW